MNVPRAQARSLEAARAQGADVRPVASPLEAARIARDNPDREVVFFAAGFETTTNLPPPGTCSLPFCSWQVIPNRTRVLRASL